MKAIAAVVMGLAFSGTLLAADVTQHRQRQETPQLSRKAAVYELVMKWGPSASRAQGRSVLAWADSMVSLFGTADLANLNKARSATTYSAMTAALTGAKTPSTANMVGVTPQTLGSLTSDLVFTPLASCVIVDTRPSSGGVGPFTPGAVRHFKASGVSFAAQGGSNTNCGIPAGIGSLLVSVSAIAPTSGGYFRLWPYSTPMPVASNISYVAGQNTQNEIVMATSVGLAQDFSVQSAGSSNVVVNVLGYFAAPVATTLDCLNIGGAEVTPLDGESAWSDLTCPTGYTVAATSCETTTSDDTLVNIDSFLVEDYYACAKADRVAGNGINASFAAWANCCRVPGR